MTKGRFMADRSFIFGMGRDREKPSQREGKKLPKREKSKLVYPPKGKKSMRGTTNKPAEKKKSFIFREKIPKT
ncbi:hypothetical protein I4100191B2_20390 [Clostridiales bacterium]